MTWPARKEKSWTSEELLQRIVQSADRIDEMMKLSEREQIRN